MTTNQFKQSINLGDQFLIVGYEDSRNNEPLQLVPVPEKMQGWRTVTYKDTTGFYLNATPEDGTRGSFCGWPKASELETVNANNFIISWIVDGKTIQRRHYQRQN